MENYIHDIPTKLYFGRGEIKRLACELQKFGNRVLLAYGKSSIKRNGIYDAVMDILRQGGFVVTELSGIDPNPRIESVQQGVKLCKENHIDVILAVGGGSTIDCAKAVACGVYYEGNDLWEMVTSRHDNLKALPLIDILTVSATGSEFDQGGVISNLTLKQKVGNTFTYPSVSICDPTYTFSVSAEQTAAGAADIMSHIFEGYFSRTEDAELSDGIAETILRSVLKNAPIALREPHNYAARANLMAAASVACSGIPEYGKEGTGWPCHALEHELSAFYDITHGVGLAILTPRWMRHILALDKTTLPRFVRFGTKVMDLKPEDFKSEMALGKQAIAALEDFFRSIGIPMSLSELNIDEKYFDKMAAQANLAERTSQQYVTLTKDDAVEIYRACL